MSAPRQRAAIVAIIGLVLCVPLLLLTLDWYSKHGDGTEAKPAPITSSPTLSLHDLQGLRTLNVTSKSTAFPNWHTGADSKRFTDEAISYLTSIAATQGFVVKANAFSVYYGKTQITISCDNTQPTSVGGNGSSVVYCSSLERFVIAPSSFHGQKRLIVAFVDAVAYSINNDRSACVAGAFARKLHDQGKVIAAEAIDDANLKRSTGAVYALGYADPTNC